MLRKLTKIFFFFFYKNETEINGMFKGAKVENLKKIVVKIGKVHECPWQKHKK